MIWSPRTLGPGSSGVVRTSVKPPQHLSMYAVVAEKALSHQLDSPDGLSTTVASQSPVVQAAAQPHARSQRPQFCASLAVLVSQSV